MPNYMDHAPGTFCWPELYTTDQDAAKRFYAALFGWEIEPVPLLDAVGGIELRHVAHDTVGTKFRRRVGVQRQARIADLENTIYQDKPFTYMHAVSQTESLVMEVNSIARNLNELSGQRYAELAEVAQAIAGKIFAELLHKRHFEDTSFVLPIERLSLENAGEVGGKAANLG